MTNNNGSSIIKQDLQDLLQQLPTKDDFRIIQNELSVLKRDINTIKHDLKSARNDFGTQELKMDLKLDRVKMDLDENARAYRDSILTRMDGVMKELETIREEQIVGGKQVSDLQGKVKANEKEVAKIKRILQAS